jgi:hypothetical protein
MGRSEHGPENCPRLDSILDWVVGRVDERRALRLEEHRKTCVRCQAEVDLARACLADAETPAGDERTRFVLQATDATIRSIALPEPTQRTQRVLELRRLWPVAASIAAAILVFALDPFGSRPVMDLPSEGTGTERGGRVLVLEPEGPLEAGPVSAPIELRWRAYEGAVAYRVTINDVTEALVHETTTSSPRLILDKDVRIHPAVRYTWRVEALDELGKVVGVSRSVDFSLPPADSRGGDEEGSFR